MDVRDMTTPSVVGYLSQEPCKRFERAQSNFSKTLSELRMAARRHRAGTDAAENTLFDQ
jgi:hypothetical protein